MTTEQRSVTLIGPGHLRMSGGCLGPMSLEVTLEPAPDGVSVQVDDRWRPGAREPIRTCATIADDVFLRLVRQVEAVCQMPVAQPTYSSSALGVSVSLPLGSGTLEVSACEMVEGPPVGPLVEALEALVESASKTRGARTERPAPGAEAAAEARRGRRELLWAIGGVLLLVAVSLGIGLLRRGCY
jgi:hypothetical protein